MFRRSFLKLFSLFAVPKPLARPLFQTVARYNHRSEAWMYYAARLVSCGWSNNHRSEAWMYYAARLDAVPDANGVIPTVLARHRLTEEPKIGSIVTMSNGNYRYRITEVRREPKLTPQDEWRLAGKPYEEIASLEGQKNRFRMWSDPTD